MPLLTQWAVLGPEALRATPNHEVLIVQGGEIWRIGRMEEQALPAAV